MCLTILRFCMWTKPRKAHYKLMIRTITTHYVKLAQIIISFLFQLIDAVFSSTAFTRIPSYLFHSFLNSLFKIRNLYSRWLTNALLVREDRKKSSLCTTFLLTFTRVSKNVFLFRPLSKNSKFLSRRKNTSLFGIQVLKMRQ